MPSTRVFLLGTLLALTGVARAEAAQSTRFIQLQAGSYHTCGVLTDGQLKCWGANYAGQLGLGDTRERGSSPNTIGGKLPPVDLGKGRKVVTLWPARNHTCATLDDGALKCWGRNASGSLGSGSLLDIGSRPWHMGDSLRAVDLGVGRKAVYVAIGNSFTCAILDNQDTKCWGNNDYGQLGLEDLASRGGTPSEMGDRLRPLKLGGGRHAIQVVAGNSHACALLDDHGVKCWGEGALGQLGSGSTQILGATPGSMGDQLPYVDLGAGRSAVHLAASANGTCAVLDDYTVKCWGANFYGELGLGDLRSRGANPNEMGDRLPAIDLEQGLDVTSIAMNSYHVCTIFFGSFMKCWGANFSGQLGLGDLADRGGTPDQMGINLPPVDLGPLRQVTSITVGGGHTCALFTGGTAKCWGDNYDGQLGYGDRTQRGHEPTSMGEILPELSL